MPLIALKLILFRLIDQVNIIYHKNNLKTIFVRILFVDFSRKISLLVLVKISYGGVTSNLIIQLYKKMKPSETPKKEIF